MREITAHKVNGCNQDITIETPDDLTVGGAPSTYNLTLPPRDNEPTPGYTISFQNGPINEVGTNGLTHEALIAVVVDRLQAFQRGPYACRENALALTHLEDAQHWLQHRTRARPARGVEGTHAK